MTGGVSTGSSVHAVRSSRCWRGHPDSSPLKARCPVSISKSTTPNDQISARLSTALPRACSGAMYAAVPRITPAVSRRQENVGEFMRADRLTAIASASIAFARPKSSTFTAPSRRTLIFAGLRSRWMMPCSCAASSASAICRAIASTSLSGNGPRAISTDRSSPVDQFHHQGADSLGFLDAVDRADVGMIQRRECLRFAREAARRSGSFATDFRQDF